MTQFTPTLARLDTEAASRQAIGKTYARSKDLGDRLDLYRSGVLHLPPHPKWSGDVTDWSADPFEDRNWGFQHHTLRWLAPLRWAALDGDEQARAEWLRVARSWFESNVPASIAQNSWAWRDMADGNRAINLSLGAALVESTDTWFVELLEAHRDWLMDETHIVANNHGLHQHCGLFVVGAVLRDESAMDTAVRRMVDQFAVAFDDQGCNVEGSIAYHQMNLRWWSQAWDRVAAEGREIPASVARTLAAAEDVLVHVALPNGYLPQLGDTARIPVGRGHGRLADYVASGGQSGRRPKGIARVFEGGYVTSRSGWGQARPMAQESHLVLRHGRDVRAHSHHDLGSVHIFAAGERWLVDGGFHSYQLGDPIRKHLESRAAHNVAMLRGLKHDDSQTVQLERAEITAEAHDFVVVDRGYADIELRRRVTYLVDPDCWVVWDSADTGEYPLVQQWHVETGVAVQRHDRGFRLRSEKGAMGMTWLGASPKLHRHKAGDGDLRGWVGTRWRTLEPGVLITAETAARPRGAAVLIAPAGVHPLGIVDSYINTAGVLTATLVRDAKAWTVRLDGQVSVQAL